MPNCGYCKDCKWYERLRFSPAQARCLLIIGATSQPPQGAPRAKAAVCAATVELDWPVKDCLKVWRNFGCVQFEPKE